MIGAKTCPFCKGEPEFLDVHRYLNEHLGTCTFITMACSSCGAQLKEVNKPFFMECSNHTVQDFRENPALRKDVDIVLAARITDVKSNLLVHWNKQT